MSIEEIIDRLEFVAGAIDGKKGAKVLCGSFDARAVRDAIALLKTHPDAQPNEPLTLGELREMKDKPVWVQSPGIPEYGSWQIVAGVNTEDGEKALFCCGDYTCRDYGKVWVAYRRPPKEETP